MERGSEGAIEREQQSCSCLLQFFRSCCSYVDPRLDWPEGPPKYELLLPARLELISKCARAYSHDDDVDMGRHSPSHNPSASLALALTVSHSSLRHSSSPHAPSRAATISSPRVKIQPRQSLHQHFSSHSHPSMVQAPIAIAIARSFTCWRQAASRTQHPQS